MVGAVGGLGSAAAPAPAMASTVPMDFTLPQNVPFADSPYASYGDMSYTPGTEMFNMPEQTPFEMNPYDSFAGYSGPSYTTGSDMPIMDIPAEYGFEPYNYY
jgi:hypothetical protein